MLITVKKWIYRPENEFINSQWRSYLGEEARPSLGPPSAVMVAVKLLAPRVSGASTERVSGKGRTEGRGRMDLARPLFLREGHL